MKRETAPKTAIAICVTELAGDAPAEIQLTPDGDFRARDGRPTDAPAWHMDAETAAQLIAASEARQIPYVLDYEHQTLNAERNGQPAPAAGWFKQLIYRPGQGLFAAIEWTERARQMIAAKEYRFISPVLGYAKGSGKILALFHAALTNNPAIDNLPGLAAQAAATFGAHFAQEVNPMDLRKAVIVALALEEDANDDAITGALDALKSRAETAETSLAELKAISPGATPDPAKFVKTEVVEALRAEIAELRTKQIHDEVEDVIAAALSDERGPLLLDAQLDWARELGTKDIAALKSYLETAAPIAALRGRQTAGRTPPETGATSLGDEQLAVLTNLGLTAEQISTLKEAA